MSDATGDTTIQLRRSDDRQQNEFKRRCAYYAMLMLVLIFARSFICPGEDVPARWADLTGTGIWAFASIILGAMGVDGVQAWASTRRQTGS